MWRKHNLLVPLFGMILAACQGTPITVIVDTSCQNFQIITFSATGDTPETVQQIREHNAAWRSICV
jgi:hypothetical protein